MQSVSLGEKVARFSLLSFEFLIVIIIYDGDVLTIIQAGFDLLLSFLKSKMTLITSAAGILLDFASVMASHVDHDVHIHHL